MGGGGPGYGGDVAGGCRSSSGLGGEALGEEVAEGAEDFGEVGGEGFDEDRFGLGRFERWEIDEEGAVGDGLGKGAIGSDDEEDGAADGLLDGGIVVVEVEGDAGAGGDAAHGVGEARGEVRYLIEGEDPVVVGEVEELGGGTRGGSEGRGVVIDEGAEDSAGDGFAADGGAAEDEDGIGAFGSEGSEEPGEGAEPGDGVGGAEVEEGAEAVEGVVVGGFGWDEGAGAGGGFEGE